MATTTQSVTDICAAAQHASRQLATLSSGTKDAALRAIADAVCDRRSEVLEANERDCAAGRESGLSEALIDRLTLDPGRLSNIAAQVRAIAALPDPVGELVGGGRLENGLEVRKVRVPLGVIGVVYEARPNVTIDATALCLKSGNAVVLRGSRTALHSNAALAAVAAEAAAAAGIPDGAISFIGGGDRAELADLATQTGVVDLIIPRGGDGLKEALTGVATVPVIYAAAGNCHVFVDASADLLAAQEIAVNAKVQRPGVCNAAETLLVHSSVADAFLPGALRALADHGVVLHGDDRVRRIAAGIDVRPATPADWDTEYLALELSVGVVDSVADAVEHINRHGSKHSEAIVTSDLDSARTFQQNVDAACVYVNASTRFTDGAEFGMGAEIGNSTQKLHARGPIGLRELCTVKYLVDGSGHVRI